MILADAGSDSRQRFGRQGEAAAEDALRRAGLRVVARRFRLRSGEIDLIAEDGDVLVFVEVKARRLTGYGHPAESVTRVKQRRIARTALAYLQRHDCLERPCRFDVVELVGEPGGPLEVRHIIDAFRLWRNG